MCWATCLFAARSLRSSLGSWLLSIELMVIAALPRPKMKGMLSRSPDVGPAAIAAAHTSEPFGRD